MYLIKICAFHSSSLHVVLYSANTHSSAHRITYCIWYLQERVQATIQKILSQKEKNEKKNEWKKESGTICIWIIDSILFYIVRLAEFIYLHVLIYWMCSFHLESTATIPITNSPTFVHYFRLFLLVGALVFSAVC